MLCLSGPLIFGAAKAVTALGASFFTVHASGGSAMIRAAVEAVGVVLLFSTMAVWGVVVGRTVAALRSGDAWVRHG